MANGRLIALLMALVPLVVADLSSECLLFSNTNSKVLIGQVNLANSMHNNNHLQQLQRTKQTITRALSKIYQRLTNRI